MNVCMSAIIPFDLHAALQSDTIAIASQCTSIKIEPGVTATCHTANQPVETTSMCKLELGPTAG
jgi:hypothetical protein